MLIYFIYKQNKRFYTFGYRNIQTFLNQKKQNDYDTKPWFKDKAF